MRRWVDYWPRSGWYYGSPWLDWQPGRCCWGRKVCRGTSLGAVAAFGLMRLRPLMFWCGSWWVDRVFWEGKKWNRKSGDVAAFSNACPMRLRRPNCCGIRKTNRNDGSKWGRIDVHFSWWAGGSRLAKFRYSDFAQSRSQSKIEAFGHKVKLSRPKISQIPLY